MRTLDVAMQGALRNVSAIVPRNFIVVTAKTRDTGVPSLRCFWDDADIVTVSIADENDNVVDRNFAGDGAVLAIDPIPMRIGLEVRTIQIALSALHAEVIALCRTDEPRGAKVEIYRGLLDPASLRLVARPRIRFLGKINEAPIETPAVGGEGSVTLRVVSHTRELTRTNPARKSDAQQQLRQGDRFRRYAGVAAEWPIWWGQQAE